MSRDFFILVGGFVLVSILVVLAAILPIYRLQDGSYVRRFIWDPPLIAVGHGYDLLSPGDIERLSKDAVQREILSNMKNAPRSLRANPIWIGTRYGPGRNPLGMCAFLSIVLYLGWIVYNLRQ